MRSRQPWQRQSVGLCSPMGVFGIGARFPSRVLAAGGGYDAGPDLVIHEAPDGKPWLWEIERASQHPEHIAAGLAALRRTLPAAE